MSILALAVRAGDTKPEDVNPCIFLYGPPGAGKTWAACAGGRPLVALTERNGLTTILHANPDAMIVHIEDTVKLDAQGNAVKDAAGIPVVMKALDVLRELVIAAKSGEIRRAGYDRLVLDSLTELQRLFKDEIQAAKGTSDAEFSLQDWGTLNEKMRKFLRTLRALPLPVAATGLDEQVQDGEGTINVKPAFEGKKTSSEVAQYFNAVGFCAKRVTITGEGDKAETKAVYRVMFDGPARYMTKSCSPGVTGVQEANVPGWLNALAGITSTLSSSGKAALEARAGGQ